ncbi:MAG TPA: hypothetical protein VL625_11985 [Patescibacteria group bacterium]|nr:hypothetical protein [Patescibacteria group bacterium]
MPFKIDHYPDSLKALNAQISAARAAFPNTRATRIAQILTEGGMRLDLERAHNLGIVEAYRKAGVVRNPDDPMEYDSPNTGGGAASDDPAHPLPDGEQWNEGRRKTLTGVSYELDEKGRPINPYMNTGLRGRGMMWLYGPNHCVDNGVLQISPDENGTPTLYIVGIRRKDDPQQRPAMSGGFAKFRKTPDGGYVLDEDAILETRLEEFFEEMISDSVPLLPEYEARIEKEYADAIARTTARPGTVLTEEHKEEIKEQVVTALKLQQVRDLDPGFLDRLREFLSHGRECFAGPVISTGRATNNSWIESRQNWVLLEHDRWRGIVGNGRFNYQLSGGDDSAGVHHFPVTPETIRTALPSHGPMMTFMLASFLLDRQEKGIELHPNIMRQLEDLADFYSPAPGAQPSGPAPR